jgi:hypothetical protein
MASILRKAVSGTRRRMVDQTYNIDLSYICKDRIIAMSYPAQGNESLYRNDYRDVSSHNLF